MRSLFQCLNQDVGFGWERLVEEIRHIVRFYVAGAFARRNGTKLPDLEKP